MSTFCPLPWIFQAVRNNGDFRLCCQANSAADKGILRFEDGENASTLRNTSSEARNLPLMRETRLQMLNGRWPASCERCKVEEEAGLRSRRSYENRQWEKVFTYDLARERTRPDGTIDLAEVPLISLDLRFGNKCNLKCRMCGPTDSDYWYDDHVALYGKTFQDTQGEVTLAPDSNGRWQAVDPGYRWYDNSAHYWQGLWECLPQLQHIHIVGGEPLILEKHYDLLKQIVERGHAGHISLEYNTNLTVLPSRILSLWDRFYKVRIGVSLDGVGELNNYIRYPSRWESIVKNLKKLDETGANIEVWLSATIQVYNVYFLPELMVWKAQQNFKKINQSVSLPLITSHPLHNPKHLNIKCLPTRLKDLVTKKFLESHQRFGRVVQGVPVSTSLKDLWQQRFGEILHGYSRYMTSDDLAQHYPEFLTYTSKLDQLRNQSFPKINPDFFN